MVQEHSNAKAIIIQGYLNSSAEVGVFNDAVSWYTSEPANKNVHQYIILPINSLARPLSDFALQLRI